MRYCAGLLCFAALLHLNERNNRSHFNIARIYLRGIENKGSVSSGKHLGSYMDVYKCNNIYRYCFRCFCGSLPIVC